MKKRNYSRQSNPLGKQTVFSNVHEGVFNPVRKFYGLIDVGDKTFISHYDTKFRSHATDVFNQEAKELNGELSYVGVIQ